VYYSNWQTLNNILSSKFRFIRNLFVRCPTSSLTVGKSKCDIQLLIILLSQVRNSLIISSQNSTDTHSIRSQFDVALDAHQGGPGTSPDASPKCPPVDRLTFAKRCQFIRFTMYVAWHFQPFVSKVGQFWIAEVAGVGHCWHIIGWLVYDADANVEEWPGLLGRNTAWHFGPSAPSSYVIPVTQIYL